LGKFIPAVKEKAKLERIKAGEKIEKLFPGVLQAMEPRQINDELEEVFFAPDKTSEEADIFLPVPFKVWDRIEKGYHGLQEEIAMRLFWSFIKTLQIDSKQAYFTHDKYFCILHCNFSKSIINSIGNVTLFFSNEIKTDIIISELDSNIREAIFG
jgi:hypothetical protein